MSAAMRRAIGSGICFGPARGAMCGVGTYRSRSSHSSLWSEGTASQIAAMPILRGMTAILARRSIFRNATVPQPRELRKNNRSTHFSNVKTIPPKSPNFDDQSELIAWTLGVADTPDMARLRSTNPQVRRACATVDDIAGNDAREFGALFYKSQPEILD